MELTDLAENTFTLSLVSTNPMWSRVAYLKFSHLFQLNRESSSWNWLHFKDVDDPKKKMHLMIILYSELLSVFILVSFFGQIWPCICKSLNSQEIQNLPPPPYSLFFQPKHFRLRRSGCIMYRSFACRWEKNQENCNCALTQTFLKFSETFFPLRAFPSHLLRRDLSTSPALATVIVKRVYKPPLVKMAGV